VLKRPLDLDVRLRIARIYRLLDKPRHAIEHYRSVARYLAVSGQPLPAMAVAKELLQVEPGHEETLLFLARLYARSGNDAGRVAVPLPSENEQDAYLAAWPRSETGIWRALDASTLAGAVSAAKAAPEEDMPAAPGGASVFGALLKQHEKEEELSLDEADVLEESAVTGEHALEIHTDEIEASEEDISADDIDEAAILDNPPPAEMVALPGDMKLPLIPLFSTLPPAAFVELGNALVHKTAAPGDLLWKEGDDALFVILIAAGEAMAFREDAADLVELAMLKAGDFAGVFALLSERRRQANLKAMTDLTYFELHRNVIEKLARANPTMASALKDFFRERVVANVLSILPVFKKMDAGTRLMLAQRFKVKQYRDGDELFYDGAELSGLWVILEGVVHVGRENEDGEFTNAKTLLSGHFVGTVAALEAQQTDGAAVAEGDVTTVTLSHRAFAELAEVHPALKELRAPLAEAGLSVTPRIFGGSAQLPDNLQPSFLKQTRG